ncbi:hypothetical protein JHK87_000610 [Glycine soja]|nr:hypothetical protein JHK87_000610 [Glycine soja]
MLRKYFPEEKGPITNIDPLGIPLLLLERYAYAVAFALHGVRNILHKDFMIQLGPSALAANGLHNGSLVQCRFSSRVFGMDKRYWFIPAYSEEDIRRMAVLQGLEYPSTPDFNAQDF